MDFQYINDTYNVPAEIGREIIFQKTRKGVIVKDMGSHIGVNFDSDKSNVILPLHPTWEVEYLGLVKPRKMTKGQQRYRDYLAWSDCYSGTFADYLRIKKK